MINLFYFLLNFHLLHNFQCVEMQLVTYDKVSVIDISNIYIRKLRKENIQRIFELKERFSYIFFDPIFC